MRKYYLFGAGINGIAAIQFFGKQNILAVIDNDERKQGKEIEGISIISLNQYLEKSDRSPIIITGFMDNETIACCLEKNGIFDFYKCPYMQTGFYANSEDIICKLGLYNYRKIYFYTNNPLSEMIEDELGKKYKNTICNYMDQGNIDNIEIDMPIIVTNQDEKLKVEEICKKRDFKIILDINDIYEKEFAFNNEKILKFKDIHKGKRCFIIGNGPSLSYFDLEILDKYKEICFGVNRIYLSYQHTKWRPNYYVNIDCMVIQNDKLKINDLNGIKFIRHFYKKIDNLDLNDMYEFRGLSYQPGQPQISFDMYQGVYMGNTVIYDAIQIALYMGFSEIYLLGVDMTTGVRCEDKGSHFYENINHKEVLGIGNIKEAKKCLEYAGNTLEKFGIKLRNATRGGELEEIKRVNFDELFS